LSTRSRKQNPKRNANIDPIANQIAVMMNLLIVWIFVMFRTPFCIILLQFNHDLVEGMADLFLGRFWCDESVVKCCEGGKIIQALFGDGLLFSLRHALRPGITAPDKPGLSGAV